MYITELQFRDITLYCHRLITDVPQKDTPDIYLANSYPKKYRLASHILLLVKELTSSLE